ncbi:MAG TPA: tetratricopeptide repeat protein [Pyrinomonadaceae bacterium]|jgi:tetratricopeptide (TPR) repeat protein
MYLRSSLVPLLVLLVAFQSPGDSFRKHYETAEARRTAGDLAGAEAAYREILADAYHKLGRSYTAQADYSASVAALEAAALYRPDSVELLVELSIACFHAEQYQKGIEPLKRALARDPQSVAARHMLGKTFFMLGEFEKAVAELESALKLAPKDYDAAYTLGLAHLKRREFQSAKQIYDRMIEQLGDRPQLRVLIGRAYRETGFLAEAIEEFKKAARLDPKFPRVHYYLGLTYLLKDGAARLPDAAEEFRIELAANPEEFFANYYLGIVHTIERKWAASLGFLQKAAALQPDNPDPYFYLGQAYQGLERHAEAIEAFRKAIALNPSLRHNDYQVTNAHYRLGQSLVKIGRKDEGERELKIAADLKTKAFKRDEAKVDAFVNAADLKGQNKFPELVSQAGGIVAESKRPSAKASEALKNESAFFVKLIATAHNNIGMLRAERRDFRAAAEQFGHAARWNPSHQGIDYNLGLAHFKSEAYKDAIAPLERELKANRSNLSARQLLGLSYFMTDDYAKASPLLTEVVAAKPSEAALYYPLALSLSKQGKTDAAARVVKQMIAMGGNTPQIHILLGQAYYEQGDATRALAELQTALSLDARAPLAHFYAGLIHLKTGKHDEATREFEAELALNPSDVQTRYHLAYVLLARQETTRGLKLMREVVEAMPDLADARFELGKTLLQQGDTRGAIESLELAARLAPEQAHVHYQLGRAYLAAGRKPEGERHLEISRQLKEKARTGSSSGTNSSNQPNR